MKFSEIILENRIDDFRNTYSRKYTPEQLKKIIDLIPQKFLMWVGKNFDSYWKIRFLANEQKNDFFIELKRSDVNNKRVQRYLAMQETEAMAKEDADTAMTEKKIHLQELQHDLENRLIRLTDEYKSIHPKLGIIIKLHY
jgi:hypothetical protein